MDGVDDQLNSRALLALLGLSTRWREDLAALLRSEMPISYAVRTELADAFEGVGRVSLTLAGHQSSARRIDGILARRGWFELGRAVSTFVLSAENVNEAFFSASDTLQKGEDECRKQYYYFKHCTDWVEANRSLGRHFSRMTDQALQDVWHISSIDQDCHKPCPPSAEEFDQLRDARIEFFREQFDGWNLGSTAAQAFTLFCELLPPESG